MLIIFWYIILELDISYSIIIIMYFAIAYNKICKKAIGMYVYVLVAIVIIPNILTYKITYCG